MKVASFVVGVLAVCVCGTPSGAQRLSLDAVDGIRFVAGRTPTRVVADSPTAFSSATLCGLMPLASGAISARIGSAFARINRTISGSGFMAVRPVVTLSTSCSAQATLAAAPRSPIHSTLVLKHNRVRFNLTTPDVAGVGLPRSTDPTIELTFDLTLVNDIAVPGSLAGSFTSPTSTAHIAMIDTNKDTFTGQVLDVATSVVDFFIDGRLGRELASDHAITVPIVNAMIVPMNAALAASRPGQSQLEQMMDRGSQLVFRSHHGEAYVDDHCVSPYVWRMARPDDHVCVTTETRARTRTENAEADQHRTARPNPGGSAACVDGANCHAAFRIPCKTGYVWREAFPNDYVCVTVASRAQARRDNADAGRRRQDYVSLPPH